MLNERKATYCLILFMSAMGKSVETANHGSQGLGVENVQCLQRAQDVYRCDDNSLEFKGAQLGEYTQNH